MFKKILVLLSPVPALLFSQSYQIRIKSYYLLELPESTSVERIPHFRKVIHNIDPDVLVVQEIYFHDIVYYFGDNILNYYDANLFTLAIESYLSPYNSKRLI